LYGRTLRAPVAARRRAGRDAAGRLLQATWRRSLAAGVRTVATGGTSPLSSRTCSRAGGDGFTGLLKPDGGCRPIIVVTEVVLGRLVGNVHPRPRRGQEHGQQLDDMVGVGAVMMMGAGRSPGWVGRMRWRTRRSRYLFELARRSATPVRGRTAHLAMATKATTLCMMMIRGAYCCCCWMGRTLLASRTTARPSSTDIIAAKFQLLYAVRAAVLRRPEQDPRQGRHRRGNPWRAAGGVPPHAWR
jgi:hypothetical protein